MIDKYWEKLNEQKDQAERLMNERQFSKCKTIIRSSTFSNGVVVLSRVPFLDTITITTTQITMVLRLGKVFDINVTEVHAKELIIQLATTYLGRNFLKSIPIIGSMSSAIVAAYITEVIGWTAAVKFFKVAKEKWAQENIATTTESSSTEDTDEAERKAFIDSLIKEANAFITGKKKRCDYENDYLDLLTKIEKIIDSLPYDHQLRKLYDQLTLIID